MNDKNFVSQWDMQQYLLGELPAEEFDLIRVRELCDDEFRARLDALRASHAEIKAQFPTAWFARKVRLSADTRNTRSTRDTRGEHGARGRSWARAAVPLFACIAFMVTIPIYMSSSTTTDGSADDPVGEYAYGERIKGEDTDAPRLQVWRKTESDPERLAPNATAREGDILQLWYAVPAPCYGAIVSVDGNGAFTVHLSGDGGNATSLTSGRAVAMPSAYWLDNAPRYEIFYLVTSPDIFDLEPVKAAILASGRAALSANARDAEKSLSEKLKMRVTSFALRKLDGGGT